MITSLKQFAARALAFLRAHRAARIAVYLLCAVLLFIFIFHPRGTKSFLVLGMDNYGSLEETGRSDVMMLVQVDFSGSEISTVTFARDMFIPDEEGRTQRINSIVRQSDEDALVTAIENAFHLEIDGWFRVNFTTVIELVDAIGGVHVDLSSKEANYIDKNAAVYPDYPLAEGECHLNGHQALTFARCRKLDNDIGRGQRQNRLMAAMVAQTKRMTIANVIDVFQSLKHAWTSSLSAAEQVQLVGSALWLRGAHVNSIGVPFDGQWKYRDSGIELFWDSNIQMLHEALGLPQPKLSPAP